MTLNTAQYKLLRGVSLFLFVFVALLMASFTQAQLEEDRVAFVIGNANYSGSAKLDNPTNDANAISDELKKLGFETHLFQNMKLKMFLPSKKNYRNASRKIHVWFFITLGMVFRLNQKIIFYQLMPISKILKASQVKACI